MATIRKIRSKWQVLIRKHNLKPIYKTFILKEDAVKWSSIRGPWAVKRANLAKNHGPRLNIKIVHNFICLTPPHIMIVI
jgi:hypothetical protein